MRNKVVALSNKDKQTVFLHCARVYEATDRKAVLELSREKQTEDLWWHMDVADRFSAGYEFRQEDKCVILTIDQELITAMFSYKS